MSEGAGDGSTSKTVADLLDLILTDPKKFVAFVGLVGMLLGVGLVIVWLVPKLLKVKASEMTIAGKGSQIVFKATTATQDQYYLVVSPQASWQPTHIYVKQGAAMTILADGRVNVDSNGLSDEVKRRINLEGEAINAHPGLRQDTNHTPEEYYSEQDWQSLVPPHYWSDPEGDNSIADNSFAGRKKYKIAPDLPFGALIGTIMARDDVDSTGQAPPVEGSIFLIGRRWPRGTKEDTAPASGYLWLAINDVVEPTSLFPKAKGIRLHDVFLLDNLGFYRAVVALSH
jgi:hypothetical protein